MTWLLVPQSATATEAELWVGALSPSDPTAAPSLTVGGRLIALGPFARWSNGGTATVHWQRVTVGQLAGGKRYGARLSVGGSEVARATVSTLPARATLERPVTVLLASCFAQRSDRAGRVGHAYRQLPTKPDFKLLCGDQVYLDSPWWAYARRHAEPELYERLFEHYRETWTQRTAGGLGGFQALLADGSNWFAPDDHELWNNAPQGASFVRDTWTQNGRDAWLAGARGLYDVFQAKRVAASRVQRIDVGTLSFFIADTRMDRDRKRKGFMSSFDLQQLEGWLGTAGPPGVLVLGQPLFAEPAGSLSGRVGDWHLQNFEPQWSQLVNALASAKRSIVMLTGDVHFGRIARATMPSGVGLIEVIASPLSLVESPLPTRSKQKAPRTFGTSPKVAIETIEESLIDCDHFALLSFAQIGGTLRVSVDPWQIRELEAPRRLFSQPWSFDLQ